ncbi:MAG: T9SS type A sorting domain-containing protein [Melioribacteraceae bacterium]|nr:T9SS type A sorting domain-containing protein [Melioribacteraceae bacterium]MCF8353155.1 T9SS type A sorting domain-containing protein [Melioribacteraceae bacterium]MCF8393145.1 T9SS type A sorting domain-containing protein [Melioribacteraceae bacterium]MCF8418048.1 T9SS type A sorting domain-containing protein [Melioribacteraceae bacterium]
MRTFTTVKCLILVLSLFLITSPILAQEEIGGPYENDANTRMLLHFDGDLTNESDFSDDGIGNGDYSFFPTSALATLGSSIYFNNDAVSDSQYVHVPDNDNLDLTGSFTVEGWINVFTFGESGSDHRWVPRLCIKTGDEAFWRPNWWVELWGDNRWFQTGFHTADQNNWPAVTSAANIMTPGEWVHLTFIRDDERKILVQMVHGVDGDGELYMKWFGTMSYANLPVTTPIVTAQDVHMGWAGGGSGDSWLDGFIDEVRISDIVRDFAVPPVITYLSEVGNQNASVTEYPVSAYAFPFHSGGSISSAVLSYSIDDGATWTEMAMTVGSGDTLAASIPQQSTGSIIHYYLTVEDDRGQVSQYPEEGNAPKSFGIYEPNTQILSLDFEQNLTDASPYSQTVDYFAGPFYSDDAMVGTYSYEFPEVEDSAYLSVDSPFLTAEEFALDFWFKFEKDTILPYIRMIIRSASGNHVDQNYYIRTEENGQLSARYQVDPDFEDRTKADVALLSQPGLVEPYKWYNVQFERSDSLAVFKVFDEDGNLLAKDFDDEDIHLNPPRPGVTPLRIGWAGNEWEGIVRKFDGKMDGLQIWNYAALNMDTSGVVVGVEDQKLSDAIPERFALEQNYPNPFNPTTTIKFAIPQTGNVNLAVYDILGRKVRSLVNDVRSAGEYQVTWNGKNDIGANVTSGVYFYRIETVDNVQTMKMMLLR